MNRELFWKDLERTYADQDNARFDEERRQKNEEAYIRKLLGIAMMLVVLIVACFVGLGLLHYK